MFRINNNRMQMSDIDFQIQKDVLARFSLKKRWRAVLSNNNIFPSGY